MSDTERLKAFEEACEELWPAIRFFGVCGAHPQYMVAAEKVGLLLGKMTTSVPLESLVANVTAETNRRTIEAIASFLGSSPQVRALTGVGLQKKLQELVEQQSS